MTSQVPSNVPEPTFFVSLTSNCHFNNAFLSGDAKFEEGGSLCAYGKESDVVFACAAGDDVCWNTGGTCSGGSDTTPGFDEVACSDIQDTGTGSVHWCCNIQFSNCTQTKYQQNNCWSWFENPLRGVNSLAASSSASVLKASAVSQPSLTNIIVSTMPNGGYQAIWATSATSMGSAPTSTRPSTASNSASSSQHPNLSSISGASVAGIAVGCVVAGLMFASVGFFFIHRRRRTTRQRQQPLPIQEKTIIKTFSQELRANGPQDLYTVPAELPDRQEDRQKHPFEMPTRS